jgi:hypothetical protein
MSVRAEIYYFWSEGSIQGGCWMDGNGMSFRRIPIKIKALQYSDRSWRMRMFNKSEASGLKDFPLDHMSLNDMRAKEDLREGDEVVVVGSTWRGKIERFDCDRRLARLLCGGSYHWFYVKDLRKV